MPTPDEKDQELDSSWPEAEGEGGQTNGTESAAVPTNGDSAEQPPEPRGDQQSHPRARGPPAGCASRSGARQWLNSAHPPRSPVRAVASCAMT